MRITVSLQNIPADAAYWAIAAYHAPLTPGIIQKLAYSGILTINQSAQLDIPETPVGFTWIITQADQATPAMGISVGSVLSIDIVDGGVFTIDAMAGTIKLTGSKPSTEPLWEEILHWLIPMPPWEGPPLPEGLGVHWPWYKDKK